MVVLPSRTEAMGRVILEAYACRKPVVASRVDGIPHYVIDGKTGLLATPGDPNDLGEKLDAVLSDPALARQLGSAGHDLVRAELTEEAFASRFNDLVAQVVERRRTV
jgi:glycosyltransferase involved in cell wall biosynthesis